MFKENKNGLKVLTPDGYKTFKGIQKIIKPAVEITFNCGKIIKCSKKHPLCVDLFNFKFEKAIDLQKDDKVFGHDGWYIIDSITDIGSIELYDLIDVEDTVSYYTNGLLSHNCEFVNAGTGSLSEEVYNKLKSNLSEPVEILMDGKYKIFELYQEDRIYVAGVDTADGIGKDFSCIKILDITDPCEIIEAAEYYDNTIPVSEFANKVYEILCHWGKPIVCIERNNQGGQVADRLGIDMNYMDRVVSWGSKLAGRKNTQLLGMISSRNTKYNAVANARYYYSEKMALQFRNKDSLDEVCKDFVKLPNDSWGAVSGKHDDRTMALVWALMVLHDDVIDQYFVVDEVDDCGKPAKISRLAFGLISERATSIYTNEVVDGIENSQISPIAFGMMSAQDDEMAELEAEGWVCLNGVAYAGGYRDLNDYESSFFDKYF